MSKQQCFIKEIVYKSHVFSTNYGLGKPYNALSLLAPREGRLVATPVETARYQYAAACARHCLSLPNTVCRSFNYDYDYDSDTAGVCELMDRVEERTIHVRQVSRRLSYT